MEQYYSGYLTDKDKLRYSSSGGIITALSEIFIENGGIVFGTEYSEDYKHVVYSSVDSIKELDRLKGTKYCETQKIKDGKHVFERVAEELNKDKNVLFVGLGCDIGALTKYCEIKKIDTLNLYLVDIICHGPFPALVLEKYIELLEERNQSQVISFNMRKKIDGWSPSYVCAQFKNGIEYLEKFDNTELSIVFHNVAKPTCTSCKYKGNQHKGDICVGDCWGINPYMDGWNQDGVSAIIVQSLKGISLMEMIDDRFSYQRIGKDFILDHNSMYLNSRIAVADYVEFMNNLKENGLCYAIDKLPKQKASIRQIVKQIIPKAVIKYIENKREKDVAKKAQST